MDLVTEDMEAWCITQAWSSLGVKKVIIHEQKLGTTRGVWG